MRTEWPSYDPKRYDDKRITYVPYKYLCVQVSLHFVLMSVVFGLHAILCAPNNPLHILQLPPVAINFTSFFSTDSLFQLDGQI